MMEQRTMEPIIETNSDQTTDLLIGVTSGHPWGMVIGGVLGASTACATAAVLIGPMWAVVGALVGATAGGLGGRAIAEIIEPRNFDVRFWDHDLIACGNRQPAKGTNPKARGSIAESTNPSDHCELPSNRRLNENNVQERFEP
ncbi:hypothetical protein [Schlesneria paludicola]|uniref:hypothetical protein n=1 Tax=Schlesneria paludicola TaxID=360056 RepID=UPI0002F5A32C|nr:hypothetical protein [Schlesneria paludicola]